MTIARHHQFRRLQGRRQTLGARMRLAVAMLATSMAGFSVSAQAQDTKARVTDVGTGWAISEQIHDGRVAPHHGARQDRKSIHGEARAEG
jgi:hypothetical protein